jgi:hypothetical protein
MKNNETSIQSNLGGRYDKSRNYITFSFLSTLGLQTSDASVISDAIVTFNISSRGLKFEVKVTSYESMGCVVPTSYT